MWTNGENILVLETITTVNKQLLNVNFWLQAINFYKLKHFICFK